MRATPDAADLDWVRQQLARSGHEPTAANVATVLRSQGRPIGDQTVLATLRALELDTVGAGPLEALISTPGATDVLVNGASAVYLDSGSGLQLTPVKFASEAEVRRLAQRLAAQAGRRIDDASPHVDVRLPSGIRLHAILAPLARPGSLISLRIPRSSSFSLLGLRSAGTLNDDAFDVVMRLIAGRRSVVISGGTGSGKTTVLGAMLSSVPATERIVLVEDTAELRPDHPHCVALEARPGNVEGEGGVDLRTLVRQALRMRPDRLVVGEVRGGEVTELLAALNTGHEGGAGTLHANSAYSVPARFEGLGWAAGLPAAAVHSQLVNGIDIVLHCLRDGSGRRRLAEIGVLTTDPVTAGAVVKPALMIDENGRSREGCGADELGALC